MQNLIQLCFPWNTLVLESKHFIILLFLFSEKLNKAAIMQRNDLKTLISNLG